MFSKFSRLEYQGSSKRYFFGKQLENKIAESLKEYGYDLREVTNNQDKTEKIDRILVENGKEKRVQIKARMSYSGDDILMDIFEPYWGCKDERTKPGRDYVSQCEVYVCLSRDGETIRVIDNVRQKEIVEEIIKEWESNNWMLPVFDSKKYEGCQIRYTQDKAHGRPKVLMFINPKIYKENKEIKFYKMKTKETYEQKEQVK